MSNQIAIMAERLNVDAHELQSIIMTTVMPTGKDAPRVTNEQFIAFLSVANEYQLNPMVREIYAYPAKGGGIQPIVPIDGWMKIINRHPQFDGMEFVDNLDEKGSIVSITCRMFRKDRSRPVEVTEYLNECKRGTEPWQKWPARMLRHKSAMQCARYIFGISGISDPDEAERAQSVGERDMGPAVVEPEYYPQEKFDAALPHWTKAMESGKKSAQGIIEMVESKQPLTQKQKDKIREAENKIQATEEPTE